MAGFGFSKKPKKSTRHNNNNQITADQLFNTALEHHRRGELEPAEKLYKASIEKDHLNDQCFCKLGSLYLEKGMTKEAINILTLTTSLNPMKPDAFKLLSAIFKEQGELQLALNYSLKYLEICPNDTDTLMHLGTLYLILGNHEKANAALLKLLSLNPEYPDALLNVMHCFKTDDLPELKAITSEALNHNRNMLNNLSIIESVSCLGEKFALDLIRSNSETT